MRDAEMNRAKCREWRLRNPDKVRASRQRRKEKEYARKRAWLKAHPDYQKEWQKKNGYKGIKKWREKFRNTATNSRERLTVKDIRLALDKGITASQVCKLIGRSVDSVYSMRYKFKEPA